MYGNPNPYFMPNPYQNMANTNLNNSVERLKEMRDTIDKQLQNVQQTPQQVPIQQNFNITPPNTSDIYTKKVKSRDEANSLAVIQDTIFIDLDNDKLYFKNIANDFKEFDLKEVIILDEKDLKIKELEAKLREVEENAKRDDRKDIRDDKSTNDSKSNARATTK